MSCRDTAGGSASLSLVRARTGLPISQLKSLFHSLKREGSGLSDPSPAELEAWRDRQQWLLKNTNIPEWQRQDIQKRLFRSKSQPTPDGALFYAWSRLEARALQEVAVQSAKEAVDLAPPGSQFELYDFDDKGELTKVWYASYGSNLFRDRFLTYVQGGKIEGASREYWGCRDTTPPEEDIPVRFPARPMFALESYTWNGGVAFMDQEGDGTGLGRAYLVTGEQFHDIVAQENGYRPGAIDAPLSEAVFEGSASIGNVMYGKLVHIGDHEGAPVVTFTGDFNTNEAVTGTGQYQSRIRTITTHTNRPSPAYVRMIGAGLHETFGLSVVQQADYIRGCPGGDQWKRKDLVTALRGEKLPEEIEAEKRAEKSAADKRRRAQEAARKADEASRSHGWSMGVGYHPVNNTRPLWSDEPAFAGTPSAGPSNTRPSSVYARCDNCHKMGWCINRVCDSCRSGASTTKTTKRSNKKGKTSRATASYSDTHTPTSIGTVANTPNWEILETTVDGQPAYQVRTADGEVLFGTDGIGRRIMERERDLRKADDDLDDGRASRIRTELEHLRRSSITIRGLEEGEKPTPRPATPKKPTDPKKPPSIAAVRKNNPFRIVLGPIEGTTFKVTSDSEYIKIEGLGDKWRQPVQKDLSAYYAKKAADIHRKFKDSDPTDSAARRELDRAAEYEAVIRHFHPNPATVTKGRETLHRDNMTYPVLFPKRPDLLIQPNLGEAVLRMKNSDIEYTTDEVLEWVNQQDRLDPNDDSGYSYPRIQFMVSVVNDMERMTALDQGRKPRYIGWNSETASYDFV